MKPIILASTSPRRRELFGLLGLPFVVLAVDADETPRPDEAPDVLVSRLSAYKAADACRQLATETNSSADGTLVVAADTIVVLEDEVLGKPRMAGEAEWMLQRLRGRAHQVLTALTIVQLPEMRAHIYVSKTTVRMRPYTDVEIAAYVDSGDPLDKAGAYAIQHAGFHPVERIEGCYTGVVGLPLKALAQGLNAFGVNPPVDVGSECREWTGTVCCMEAQ